MTRIESLETCSAGAAFAARERAEIAEMCYDAESSGAFHIRAEFPEAFR